MDERKWALLGFDAAKREVLILGFYTGGPDGAFRLARERHRGDVFVFDLLLDGWGAKVWGWLLTRGLGLQETLQTGRALGEALQEILLPDPARN